MQPATKEHPIPSETGHIEEHHIRSSSADIQHTNNGSKNWLLLIGSAILALPLVANAFGALSHRNPKDYSWEWLTSLSGIQLVLATISGVSALAVNTFANIASVPLALTTLKETCFSLHPREFNKDREKYFKNLFIFIQSISAGTAALAIGLSGWLWAGLWPATTIAAACGLIFLSSRVFGLIKFVAWVNQQRKQQKYIKALTHLKENHIKKLNELLAERFIHNEQFGVSKQQDEKIIKFAFQALGDIIHAAPDEKWQNEATLLEYLWTGLEFTIAILAAFSILPTFGQNLFDGFQFIFNMFLTIDLNTIPTYISAITSTFLSLATPALYLRQIFTLKDALTDAAANIIATLKNPEATTWEKTRKVLMVPALLVINIFACLGIYNLVESTAQKPNNLYKDIIPTPPSSPSSQGSTAFTIFQLSATAGAMITNSNFTLSEALPHPNSIKEGPEAQTHTVINTSHPRVKVNDIARYLSKFSVTQPTLDDMSKSLTIDEDDEEKQVLASRLRPRSGAISL